MKTFLVWCYYEGFVNGERINGNYAGRAYIDTPDDWGKVYNKIDEDIKEKLARAKGIDLKNGSFSIKQLNLTEWV